MTAYRPRIGASRSAGPFVITRIDYPANAESPPHRHRWGSITLVLTGRIWESASGTEAIGSPLSVVVKPPGVRHANVMGRRGARTLQIAFRPKTARHLAEDGMLGNWRWLAHSPSAAALLQIGYALDRDRAEPSELEDGVLDAIGALDDTRRISRDPPGWLKRLKEALDDELEDGVTVRDLAERAGAHPVSVSRAFRQYYGLTVSHYRRRERIRRAADRIGGSTASLSRIAHATGHADHPHFCREFRRIAGLTPSEFRAWVTG